MFLLFACYQHIHKRVNSRSLICFKHRTSSVINSTVLLTVIFLDEISLLRMSLI